MRRRSRPRRSCRSARSRPAGAGRAGGDRRADVILFPPSNPVVSIGTILAVPGIREAIADAGVPVVGLSPIVGNAPVRGMADKVLAAVGVESTAPAVAEHYGSACWTAGWSTRSTRPVWSVSRRPGSAAGRCR
ncbi:2-phospho-L-lactate transferase CofD family protein [Streptomyces sp. INA 01156]